MISRITLGSHLAKIKTDRAAVIPYVIIIDSDGNDNLHFLLARDNDSGDITDFGGGVKQNEVSLTASLREFREESDEIFESLYDKINNLTISIAILDKTMSTLFIPIDIEWYKTALYKFNNKINLLNHSRKKSHNEVSEIIWFSEEEFIKLISPDNPAMWSRIRKFYNRNYGEQVAKALKLAYYKHLVPSVIQV